MSEAIITKKSGTLVDVVAEKMKAASIVVVDSREFDS